MSDVANVNRVKYKEGDTVYIRIADPFKKFKVLKGKVYIVDAYGTFFKPDEPSYDIMVEDYEFDGKLSPALFKHCAQHTVFDNEEDCMLYGQLSIYDTLSDDEKIQFNKNLIDKYPFLQLEENYYGSNWLIELPKGWRYRIGLKMCEDLSKLDLSNFKILDIVAKNGMLKVCHDSVNEQVDKVIEYYEKQALKVCWKCGEDAKYRHVFGASFPWCKNCAYENYYVTEEGKVEEFDKWWLEIE